MPTLAICVACGRLTPQQATLRGMPTRAHPSAQRADEADISNAGVLAPAPAHARGGRSNPGIAGADYS
jgi:hypothetical protein